MYNENKILLIAIILAIKIFQPFTDYNFLQLIFFAKICYSYTLLILYYHMATLYVSIDVDNNYFILYRVFSEIVIFETLITSSTASYITVRF